MGCGGVQIEGAWVGTAGNIMAACSPGAGALVMRTWVPEGGSRAYCVALAAKWMAETCSPRKIGPRNKPLGCGVSERRLGGRRASFLSPGFRLGVPWI